MVFGANFFLTIQKRREQHIYVAIWFYIATIVTVALLHIINSINIPVSFLKSYPVYAGVQDALVQWWYGHNAVAFFLTTPFLGLMYYYVPKAAERPVYSYRLSVIHFWSLVFIYIWAGPHHLLNTALPDWAQTLGMVFSLMLWAPSWGGMVNGLLTLRGAWDKVRTDPVIKFMLAAITFYGMATFEGPLLSIKSVTSLAHYTDWIIGHVHAGALGWNGFLTFGMLYYLVPRLWKTKLHSKALASAHFWLGTLGILLYMMSMWASGITQGLMLRAVDSSGHLMYPDFIETVMRIVPLYWVRAFGGISFLSGYVLLIYNLTKTILAAPAQEEDPELVPANGNRVAPSALLGHGSHRVLEGLPVVFSTLVVCAVLVASIFSIVPTLLTPIYYNAPVMVRPYTALELAGRDLYVREGCYVCHSQQIRSLTGDVLRYGDISKVEESGYDHPFQWGSKRTGPDLARVGGRYSDDWHVAHLKDPRSVVPESVMPSYGFLAENPLTLPDIADHLRANRAVGVPYTDEMIANALADMRAQDDPDSPNAEAFQARYPKAQVRNFDGQPQLTELDALVAYLQMLGTLVDFNVYKPDQNTR